MRANAAIGLLLVLLITYISRPAIGLAAEKHKDIEAIGARNINAGQMNFYSVERETTLRRELAEELESSHSTEQVSKGRFFNFASLPLIFLGGPAGYAIRQTAGLMLPLQMLRFNRRAEREADFFGLQYLHKAGYDPTAVVSFFEKVRSQEKHKSGFFAKAFSTHPVTTDRIRKVQKQIEQSLPSREEYALSSSEFERIKARLEVLENARKREAETEEDPNRPRLQRRTPNTVEDEDEPTSETGEDTNLQLTQK